MKLPDKDLRTRDYGEWLCEVGKALIAELRGAELSYRDAIHVLEAAARMLGAEVTVPQAKELLRYARNKRRTLKMRVECEGYAPHECRAYCRMDAVMDAANAWGVDYMQIEDKARVGVLARLPE